MSDIRFIVRQRIGEGWIVLPVKPGEKATRFPKWSDVSLSVTEADFAENDNIARRLDGVVDIDCDCAETRALAPRLLPATTQVHGRPSLGPSHFWFTTDGDTRSEVFKDTDGAVLVEIRTGRNQYTLIPPSVVMTKDEIPTPETLLWDQDRGASLVDAKTLRDAVLHLATAALLARHWPSGSRHIAARDAAGFLAARELEPKTIEAIIRGAAELAGDDEVEDRARVARDTVATFKAGGKTTGGPTLEAAMGKDVLALLLKWYGGNTSIHSQLVERMNARHFYTRLGKDTVIATVEDDGTIHFQGERALYAWYANDRIKVGVRNRKVKDDADGETKTKEEPTWRTSFEIWREQPNRRQYRTVTFCPPPLQPHKADFNLWSGYGVAPMAPPESAKVSREALAAWIESDVKPRCQLFLDMTRDVICSADLEHYEYLLNLMAFTVQEPGIPSEVCVAMKGKPGTGKGTFARTFGSLFGRHFVHLDRTEQLSGKFNASLSGKVVVFADEAFFAGDKQSLGSLKRLITEPTLTIERKGIDAVQEPNCVHLFMATNENWVHNAGENERRYFTVKVSDHRMQDHDYFEAINAQMRDGGREALVTYLWARPVTHTMIRKVPKTDELRAQVELSLDPDMKWWKEKLWEGSFGHDEPWPADVTSDQVFENYIAWCDTQRIMRRLPKITLTRDVLRPYLGERKRKGDGHVRPLLPLDKARAAFDEKFGVRTPWPVEEPPTSEPTNKATMPF